MSSNKVVTVVMAMTLDLLVLLAGLLIRLVFFVEFLNILVTFMMIELLSQFTWRRVFCGGPIHVSELILKSISTHQISKKKGKCKCYF